MRAGIALALVMACRAGRSEAADPPPVPAASETGAASDRAASAPRPRPPAAAQPAGVPPLVDTPADALDTATHRHVELLRIDRDFGKPHFDIVVDAWVPKDAPQRLAEARIWWLKRHRGDMRGPFGKRSLRHVEVRSRRLGPDRIRLSIGAGSARFSFDVVDEDGRVAAYTRVRTRDGRIVERCAARWGLLRAKKTLGIVRGIDRLEVTCRTPDGAVVEGDVVADR